MKLEETPAFRAFAEEAEKREHDRPGLGALFQVHGRQLLVCMGLLPQRHHGLCREQGPAADHHRDAGDDAAEHRRRAVQ
ncbi:hypothetical protein G6F35_017436 [Rhizopus arrhizus]|nr:hypothetical protein G6F35_017436 [Rhizopus arrhizus]